MARLRVLLSAVLLLAAMAEAMEDLYCGDQNCYEGEIMYDFIVH